jgi:predicted nucleotidyltransferase
MDEVIFEATTGSQLYGCATADSDIDIVRVIVEPMDEFVLSGGRKTNQTISANTDTTTYALASLCKQLKKGSPNLTPLLRHPNPILETDEWEQIAESRDALRSVQTLQVFFMAGASGVRNLHQKFKFKPAATAYRWLSEVICFAKNGEFIYPLEENILDEYIAIREGTLDDEEIFSLLAETETKASKAIEKSSFKQNIDTKYIDQRCVSVYKTNWGYNVR